MIRLNPYLHFKDNAREAMEFYKTVFGGKLDMSTFKDAHMSDDPVEGEKIMHAMLEGENGIVFMASDTPPHVPYEPGGTITMSLSGEDESVLRGYWDKLTEGGKISYPLEKAPWGDTFGMFTDKFGIEWMVDITAKKSAE